MVQKINPLGFRLGVTQNERSHWFAQQRKYSKDLREDQKIRTCIENYQKIRTCIENFVRTHIKSSSNYGEIARVEIRRKIDLIKVKIYIGFPNLLLIEGRGQGIEKLRNDVLNMLEYHNILPIVYY